VRRLYLLGYPIAHSLSPAMQNSALKALGLNYEYSLLPVPPEELGARVGELRDKSIVGFNITIPHKVAVLPMLDELDVTASIVGAVNTVVNQGGRLVGYNTDSVASSRILRESYGDLSGCRAVIIGTGGAARAIASGLSPHAKMISILARDEAKAELLAKQVRTKANSEVQGRCLGEAVEIIRSADILVNATPVGMHPYVDASPVEARHLHSGLLVFDLVYNPERTRLLVDAEAAGARSVGGLRMLVYQGAEAFRLWTGVVAPEELMLGAARAALGGATA
jgi:shikimate dehydrogenase